MKVLLLASLIMLGACSKGPSQKESSTNITPSNPIEQSVSNLTSSVIFDLYKRTKSK